MKRKHYTIASCLIFIGFFSTFFPQYELFAQACPGLGSVTLNVVAAPVPTLSAPNQLCVGAGGTISTNGTFSSYVWNTGSSNPSIAINGPGFYTVTVTNATGCTGTASANENSSPPP
ncbi:MAG: hypothetical protein LH618_08125 [Saprospiraceae bacterium]|nr:hypothetical protein [Saprospiraceae bacterium]